MISIKELKKNYRDPRNIELQMSLVGQYVYSNLAMPITKLLLPTKVTPDQITIVGLITGIIGCILLMFGNYWAAVSGIVVFQIAYTLDYVDGTLARARGISSLTGYYMDKIAGDLLGTILFPSLGIGYFFKTNQPEFLICGSLAGLGLLFSRHIFNVKTLALVETEKEKAFYGKLPSVHEPSRIEIGKSPQNRLRSFLRMILIKSEFLWKTPYIINFILLAAIFDYLNLIVVFYGIFFPLIAVHIFIRQFRSGFEWVYAGLNNKTHKNLLTSS